MIRGEKTCTFKLYSKSDKEIKRLLMKQKRTNAEKKNKIINRTQKRGRREKRVEGKGIKVCM